MSVSLNPRLTNASPSSQEQVVSTATQVLTTLDTLFTATGMVQILSLVSECMSTGTPAASTLQYKITPTAGADTTVSGTSASMATCVTGSTITLNGTAVTTAPDILVDGPALGTTAARPVVFPAGVLKIVVGTGPTTGTWRHHLRYRPLESGAYVI